MNKLESLIFFFQELMNLVISLTHYLPLNFHKILLFQHLKFRAFVYTCARLKAISCYCASHDDQTLLHSGPITGASTYCISSIYFKEIHNLSDIDAFHIH